MLESLLELATLAFGWSRLSSCILVREGRGLPTNVIIYASLRLTLRATIHLLILLLLQLHCPLVRFLLCCDSFVHKLVQGCLIIPVMFNESLFDLRFWNSFNELTQVFDFAFLLCLCHTFLRTIGCHESELILTTILNA